jgi:hypothetical protein
VTGMENILWRHTHQKHLLTNIFRMFLAVLYLLNNIPVPADPVNSKEGHKVDFNKVHVSREGNDNEKSICSQSKNTSTLNPNISRRSLSQLDSQNEVEEDVSHNEVSQDNQSISSNPRLSTRRSCGTKNSEEGTSALEDHWEDAEDP